MSDGQRGLEAVRRKEWNNAVRFFDKALSSSNSPLWLLARAQANQGLKKYVDALQDAELAYHTAVERGSRNLMIEAQYRRACILNLLRRYADADCCLKWSMQLCEGKPVKSDLWVEEHTDAEGNYTVTMEEAKVDTGGRPIAPNAKSIMGLGDVNPDPAPYVKEWNRAYAIRWSVLGMMEKLPDGDKGRQVTVSQVPDRPEKRVVDVETKKSTALAKSDAAEIAEALQQKAEMERGAKPAVSRETNPVPKEKMTLRADFYQSAQVITVSLFVKDVEKERLKVEMTPKSIFFGPVPREAAPYVQVTDDEAFSVIRTEREINVSESKYTVTPRKIELVLRKSQPMNWTTWGREFVGQRQPLWEQANQDPSDSEPKVLSVKQQMKAPIYNGIAQLTSSKPTTADRPPSYPTSSKTGPKNWDAIVKGGDGDDEDAGVDFFFKSIYAKSSPEQQRAMVKSYTESNGTTLSTSWEEVSKGTVEINPPEGVVAKKWGE